MATSQEQATAWGHLRDIDIRSADGMTLRGRWWHVPGPRGALIIAHGFGEHSGPYGDLAEYLARTLRVDVVAVDFRGHGRSPGRRGYVRQYEDLIGDLRSVVDWAAGQEMGRARFLIGHSNGGQVVLRMVLADPGGIDGIILSNPAIRIAVPIPPSTLKLGRILLRFAPWFTLKGQVRPELLTRDPEIQTRHRTDPLRHSDMSAPLFFGMVAGERIVLDRASEIHLPMLMLIGGLDPVIDPASAREFFDRLGSEDKLLHLYPKMLHEPLNEIGREQVVDDLVRWLEPRLET